MTLEPYSLPEGIIVRYHHLRQHSQAQLRKEEGRKRVRSFVLSELLDLLDLAGKLLSEGLLERLDN
jgi:hypothetical protein